MRIGKKFIHHACLLGALVAPAVYLFGSMFMGLAGAHGEELWAQEGGQTEYWVEYEGEQYKYLDSVNYYFDMQVAVEKGDYSGELMIWFDLTANNVSLSGLDYIDQYLDNADINTDALLTFSIPDNYLSYVDYQGTYFDDFTPDEIYVEYTEKLNGNYCVTYWLSASPTYFIYTEIYMRIQNDYTSTSTKMWECDDGTVTEMHFSDAPNLIVGNYYKFGAPNDDWNVPEPFGNINYNWHSETYNQNYTDGVFGNFFPRQNFLEKWGNDAISDNPVGFAPFGQLFRYLDDNMLHFGMNGNQAGLMAYGYMYWIGHVFIADLALCCLVFIPKLLRKIVDKVGGNDD